MNFGYVKLNEDSDLRPMTVLYSVHIYNIPSDPAAIVTGEPYFKDNKNVEVIVHNMINKLYKKAKGLKADKVSLPKIKIMPTYMPKHSMINLLITVKMVPYTIMP